MAIKCWTKEEIDLLTQADLNDPAELGALIAKLQKPKWWEYPRELFYSSILSGAGTHARNTIGNALHAASRIPVRVAGAMVDAPLAKLTGRERTRYLAEVYPSMVGLGEGFMDGLIRAKEAWRRGGLTELPASKFDMPRSAFARAPNKFVREKVAPVVGIPFRALSAADELFKGINRGAELRALAVRSGIKEGLEADALAAHVSRFMHDPPEEALRAAIEFEQVMTFTNPLGKVGRHLENIKNDSPVIGYLIPFVRTPINLFKRGAEFTPLNLPRAVMMGAKGADGYADELAKTAIGTGMMGYALMKAAGGDLTGPPPRDQGERDAFFQQGKLPFSIRFGDKWYSFSQIEPIAMPLALAASAAEGFRRGEGDATNFERLQASFSLLLANQLDRSYLSGLSDLSELSTRGDEALVEFGGRQAAALGIPFSGAMRTVANAVDPRVTDKSRFRDYFKESIPGLKNTLPARQTRFGEDVTRTRWQAAGPSGTFLAPTKTTDDEVELALEEMGLRVGFPGKSIMGVRLSKDEYRAFLQSVGPKTKNLLRTVLTDEGFRQMPQPQQQAVVDKMVGSARAAARSEALAGLIPEIPPVYARRELADAVDRFRGGRAVASEQHNADAKTRRGVGEALESKEEVERQWGASYSALQAAAASARRQGLSDAAILALLKRQGISTRVARRVVAGQPMTYEDYRGRTP